MHTYQQPSMYGPKDDPGFLRKNPRRPMSSVKNRRLATISVLVVFSLLTLSFLHFPSEPGQSENVASIVDVEVAPELFPNTTSRPESLPVVPVDPFGVESNLIGLPTSQFRGTGYHLTSHTFWIDCSTTDNLRSDRKYITTWISAGWSTSQSLLFLLLTDHIL